MANHHFGNYGDVWKHLLLAEIVESEEPDDIMESHAGAASYPLSPALEREHGVGHFLNRLDAMPELATSHFARLLRRLPQRAGLPEFYPGSPHIELSLGGGRGTRYLFCDIDVDSIDSIRAEAVRLDVPAGRVECFQDDGVVRVSQCLDRLEELRRLGTLVVIDPFQLLEKNELGLSAMDLFTVAAAAGTIGFLWYAFGGSSPTQAQTRQAVREALRKAEVAPDDAWWAELALAEPTETTAAERTARSELLPGCGVVITGLGVESRGCCTRLSDALAHLYAYDNVPGGDVGRLRLQPLSESPT